jgi:hypothetical protein
MRINKGLDFVIDGYTNGGRSFDALVLAYYEQGRPFYASRTRNGFTPASGKHLVKRFKPLEIAQCPFANSAGVESLGNSSLRIGRCATLDLSVCGMTKTLLMLPNVPGSRKP